jgi:hypothetical protein
VVEVAQHQVPLGEEPGPVVVLDALPGKTAALFAQVLLEQPV